MYITIVAGARPNFLKIKPIIHAVEKAQFRGSDLPFNPVQHFDEGIRTSFFREPNIAEPQINLECSGGLKAEQMVSHLLNLSL